jgi:D-amino-acid dehydrogenase
MLPWFLRFLSCARQAKSEEIARDIASLTHHVHADYALLLGACTEQALMRESPVIKLFESAEGLEQELPNLAFRTSLGFKAEVLDAATIADLEPALAGTFTHGLLFPDWRSVSDTEGFIAALTKSFIDQGGVRVRDQVKRLNEVGDHANGVTLNNGERFAADHVVIAAGVGSRAFFYQLGVKIPLVGIAGYQVLLPKPEVAVHHSVIFPDGGFCFSPMTRGLQIGGTMEFARPNAEPNFKRAEIILERARKILPRLQLDNLEYGVGYRPYLPDSKPVIDRSTRLSNVFLAFGHGQLGLTLGATTGRLIAQMVAGREPSQNLAPFSSTRFSP